MLKFRYFALALVVLLVFLVHQIPARVVAAVLPPDVRLDGMRGRLWNGSAARAQVIIGGKSFHLGSVSWRLQPLSLLTLSPSLVFNSGWGSQQVTGMLRAYPNGSLEVMALEAAVDVRFIRELAPLYIGGRLSVDVDQLALGRSGLRSIDGRIVWQDAVWTARTGDVALGNYAMDLSSVGSGTGGPGIEGRVLTLSGPLGVDGTLSLSGRDYRVDLDLTGPATRNAGLRDSLALLAAPSAQGFDMVLEGQL